MGDERSAALAEWRQKWTAALESPGPDGRLREQLEALSAADLDTEIEMEMLDGLEQLKEPQPGAVGALPVVETHHR